MSLLKQIGVLAVNLVFMTAAMAQENQVETQVITAEPAAQVVEAQSVQAQPQPQPQVVIIQEPAAQQAVISQPTTVVESSPLVQSRAEKLRETRQQAEVETEQKIVEKLEESRLEDEKERMENLFGDKLNEKEQQPAPVVGPVVVQPQPAPVEAKEDINKDELKAEIAESVKADLQAIKQEEKKEEFRKRTIIGASLGTINYQVGGIDSDFSAGFSIGREFRERLELEGVFAISRHTTTEPYYNSIQEMDQYNFSVGLRYAVLPYFVSPVVGASASYTHRVYSVPYSSYESEMKSDALDAGFLVGVDVLLSENMSVAIDYKRFMNLESRISNNTLLNLQNYYGFEDSDYDMFNLALRYMF